MGKGGEFGSIPDSVFIGTGGSDLPDMLKDSAFNLANNAAGQPNNTGYAALAALARAEHKAANSTSVDPVELALVCMDIKAQVKLLGTDMGLDKQAAAQELENLFSTLGDLYS